MKNKIGSLGKKLGFKLIVLSIVLLFVGSSYVSSLSHTVDYSNSDYFTDDKDTRIHNSNGKYWEATGANIQLAIDDLGGASGTVSLPGALLWIANTIDVPDDITIEGQGNSTILKLESNANCTIFKNEGWDTQAGNSKSENINIHIADMTLHGNAYTHELWHHDSDTTQHTDIISFLWTNQSSIKNVRFVEATFRGICLRACSYLVIQDCFFDDIGMHKYKWNWGTGVDMNNDAIAIYVSNNITVDNCQGQKIYGNCVTVEWGIYYFGGVKRPVISRDMLITNINFDTAYAGIWFEGHQKNMKVENITVSNCIFTNITVVGPYEQSDPGHNVGIAIYRHTSNITLSKITVKNSGNYTDEGYGAKISGQYVTLDQCNFLNIGGDGIRLQGDYAVVSNCKIIGATRIGIYVRPVALGGDNIHPNIVDCTVKGTTDHAIKCDQGEGDLQYNYMNTGGKITGCTIQGANIAKHGIWNKIWNMTISNNEISGFQYGIASNEVAVRYCTYHLNRISDMSLDGIRIKGYYNMVSDNTIKDSGNDGIEVDDAINCSILNNMITGGVDGIDETGTTDGNLYIGNTVIDVSGDDYDINGACRPSTESIFEDVNMGDALFS